MPFEQLLHSISQFDDDVYTYPAAMELEIDDRAITPTAIIAIYY
jgi:hypothetical protein